jgi:hypothetical protein
METPFFLAPRNGYWLNETVARFVWGSVGNDFGRLTLEGYSRTWWDERASGVSAVVDMGGELGCDGKIQPTADRRW